MIKIQVISLLTAFAAGFSCHKKGDESENKTAPPPGVSVPAQFSPPFISSVSFNKDGYNAGDLAKINVITNGTDLVQKPGICSAVQGPQYSQITNICPNPIKVGENKFEIEFEIPAYVESGKYYFSRLYLHSEDQSAKFDAYRTWNNPGEGLKGLLFDHQAGVALTTPPLRITAGDQLDITPPEISDIKIDPATLTPEPSAIKNAKIFFTATDSGLGFDEDLNSCWRLENLENAPQKMSIWICGKIQRDPLEDNRYFREFSLDANEIEAGVYTLTYASLSDKANNYTFLHTSSLADGTLDIHDRLSEDVVSTGLPAPTLKILMENNNQAE